MSGIVSRGRVTASRIRDGRVLVDLTLLGGEVRRHVELLMPLGISSLPAQGADVMVLEVGGNRHHLVALVADDRALRITGLAPGEFGLRDAAGQQVVFRADGVEITGALKVTIVSTGPVDVQAGGIVTVEAPRINLGAGASQPVKLANDAPASKVYAI